MFTKILPLAASAIALAAAPALAGSYSEPTPEAPVAVAPAPVMMSEGWTGAYAGVNLGYGDLDRNCCDLDGTAYGLQVGYDYDFGTWVAGGEIEYQANDMASNRAYDSLRLKGRLGYDLGETLVYGVAGSTYIMDDWGYAVGLGAEYMLTDTVSVGGEYIYEQIDDFNGGSDDLTANSLAARVNYRF
ncbi:hypothetical protein PSM7751_04166 [Pseudooceanicola marinus]|uniref:Outer membrane protein beta-barrel domain-containing protein n=1 Tax=Pseudooceanicola marinus TaxID=396013 RepID=A0A1X7ABB4_9RHOB|nr:outer membrane beta-barrel protein [Pseudooceanicola marinus]SLN74519.1 hypothetical protein PSM7751_04166 [Pseudooceanicola marinus]